MNKIASLVEQLFPQAGLDLDNPELGPGSCPEWDSLAHFNLLLLVEETYGVQFTTDELSSLRTLGQISDCLREKGIEI